MKIRISWGIIDFITFLYLAVFVSMSSATIEGNILAISLAIFFIWLFIAFIISRKALSTCIFSKTYIYVIFYGLLILIAGVIGNRIVYSMKNVVSNFLVFSPIVLYYYYERISSKMNINIAKAILFIWSIVSLYSVYLYITVDEIGRSVTAGQNSDGTFALGGVVLANASVILALYLVGELKNERNLSFKTKVYYLVIIVIQFASVFMSGSTISAICLIVGTLMVFIPQKKKRLWFLFIILLCSILFLFREIIGEMIISISMNINDRTSSARINSLGAAIAYGSSNSSAGYFYDRIGRPLLSLETFISHPIFGVAYQYGNYYPDAYSYGVGCHGEWADALAKYGLFSLIYFMIFINGIKYYCKKYKIGMQIWMIGWFLLGIANPVISIATITMAFFLIPSLEDAKME